MNMAARLQKLESSKDELSLQVKAWLGQPLTDSERALLDDRAGIDSDFDDLDLSHCSRSLREWLLK